MAVVGDPGRGAGIFRGGDRARDGAIQAQPHSSGLKQTFVAWDEAIIIIPLNRL
jgi:hypothetical protein